MTVQQLKNSILQMAVQGKLVPQDPNDEPASVLLERIRAEKEQLIKQKKIKREKNPSYIFRGADNTPYEKTGNNEPVSIAEEVPFEIPDSWEWVRCASLGEIVRGSGIKRTETVADGLPCVRYGELYTTYNTSFAKTKSFITAELDEKCKHFGYGDILMTLTGENKPDIAKAVAYLGDLPVAAGGDLAFWTCHGMNPLYLVYALSCPYVISRKVHLATGDIIVHISGDKIGTILLPVPPLEEQSRIVARIEEIETLLSKYDATEHQLSTLQSTFPDQLKKSILQMAVQGKLIPQDPADEPASVLLERIRAEKQQLIAEGKIKRDKHESVIFRRDNSHYEKLDGIERCIDDEMPFEIPDTWTWSRLGNLVELITSGSRDWAKYYSDTGSLFLRMGNLSRNSFELRLSNLQRVQLPEKAEGTRTSLQSGDLLFSITGEVGMLGLIPDGFETAYINQHTAMIRFLPLIRNKYLPYFLLTDYAQKCYKSNQHGIKNSFRLDSISDILVPIPPFSEQERIVDQIEKAINRIDAM